MVGHERGARIRIRGGRISCMACLRTVTLVTLTDAGRPHCRACSDEPLGMAGLRRFVVPDDLCGPNGGCQVCRSA